MVDFLNIQTVYTSFTNPSPTLFNGGGSPSFKMEIPQSTVMIPKPLSYQFRVAEYVNEKDEVAKVRLQVAVFEHDNFGVRQLRQDFTDVERVKIKL